MTNEELIAKIKAEIERLKAKYRKDMYKSNYEGLASGYKIEAYNELLSFLDTLESGKPVPNDLEEAAQQYAEGPECTWVGTTALEYAFIAGAKWQAEQLLKSSPMPEDTVLFNKGVEEGKRLMMEGAVEGIVCYGSKGAYIETDFLGEYDTDVYGNPGDKVRVLIIKE